MVGNVSDPFRDTKMIAKKAASKPVIPGGSMSENRNAVELHGCIVCARLFNILAVYAPNGSLVGCTVTGSGGGHIVPDKNQPLVACDTHTAEEVKSARKRWQSVKVEVSHGEQEED